MPSKSGGRTAGEVLGGGEWSRSVERARWIESPDEHGASGETLATRGHDVIRRWAETRKGRPATATRGPDGKPRVLRIDFGEPSEGLEEISWDDWFQVFDDRNLVFLYQDEKKDGSQSSFFILESPERQDA